MFESIDHKKIREGGDFRIKRAGRKKNIKST